MPKKKNKITRNNCEFWLGIFLGTLTGIAGNIFVTAMYRILDANHVNGNDGFTVICALVVFVLLGYGVIYLKCTPSRRP